MAIRGGFSAAFERASMAPTFALSPFSVILVLATLALMALTPDLVRNQMDKSFLVLAVVPCDPLFFKKEQRFFLKKEAKTFYPFGVKGAHSQCRGRRT